MDESGHDDGASGGRDPLLELVRERAARDYNVPPPTPRQAIWAELEKRIRTDAAARPDVIPLRSRRGGAEAGAGTRWVGLAAAAVATLMLGVGIGRMSVPAGPGTTTVAEAGDAGVERTGSLGATAAARHIAAGHLQASESLLGFVQADAQAGRFDEALGTWGRGLLVETRMLLDSEVGADPALRELLLDLELILAQVAVLSGTKAPERGREELRLIARGLEEQQMMARIQTALPAVDVALSGS